MASYDFNAHVKKVFKDSGFDIHIAKYEKIEEKKCLIYFEITQVQKNNDEYYLSGNLHQIQSYCGCTDFLFTLPHIEPTINVQRLENNLLVNIINFNLNFKKEELYKEFIINEIRTEVLND